LPAFGSYEAWSALVRSPVAWATGVGPCDTRKGIQAADSTLTTLAAVLDGWPELPGATTGLTVTEALRYLNDPSHQDNFLVLRSALMEWSRNDRLPGAGQVGCRFRSLRGRVLNGKTLESVDGEGHCHRWKVVSLGA
jgi:hypothetical protein